MKPLILVALANDWHNPLMTLFAEKAGIEKQLKPLREQDLCDLVIIDAADTDAILQAFRDHRNRVAIFHFAGHAKDYELHLETAEGNKEVAHVQGFAEFLSAQSGLQLVFLNACSTQAQVQSLLDAGVGAVIATSQAIDERAANRLSIQFYAGLAEGSGIEKAFVEAAAAVKMRLGQLEEHGDDYYRGGTEVDSRHFPWEIYINPGFEVVRDWSIPFAAGHPLFGLPSPTPRPLPDKPFRYLRWYRPEDAEIFFGRSAEIRRLYDKITDVRAPAIVHLYGQSGVGKSSLLAAGLLPRLSNRQEVKYLRRETGMGLLGTLRQALGIGPEGSLRESWLQAEEQSGRPVSIILDQAEEAYTRGAQPMDTDEERRNGQTSHHRELDRLVAALTKVFGARRRPQGKLILSYRKEYLAEIESRFKKGRVAHSKIFLDALGSAGIRDAVMGLTTTKHLRDKYLLQVDEDLPDLIASDLLRDEDSAVAPVLQILLSKLWEHSGVAPDGSRMFTKDTYRTLAQKGLLLDDFLDQKLEELKVLEPELVESGLVQDILTFHTTSKATAHKRSLVEVTERYRHRADVIPSLLDRLKQLYLLVDVSDSSSHNSLLSLAHDTLAPLIREKNQMSEHQGQIAARIINDRLKTWQKSDGKLILPGMDLEQVELGLAGMRALTEPESEMIEASRTKRKYRRLIRAAVGAGALVAIVLIVGFSRQLQRAELEQARVENEMLQEQLRTKLLAEQLEVTASERDSAQLRNELMDQQVESISSRLRSSQQSNEMRDLAIRSRDIINQAAQEGFAGGVLLTLDDEPLLLDGFGLGHDKEKHAFTHETVAGLGSLTELFTSVAVMSLIDGGQLQLTDNLGSIFSDVPEEMAPITVRHLLTDRSGLPAGERENYRNLDRKAMHKRIWRQKLGGRPGDKSGPSVYHGILLASIVEEKSGQNFRSYCQRRIFDRAGMIYTGYNEVKNWESSLQATGYGDKKNGSISPNSWPDISWAAMGTDGLVSNIEDLGKFLDYFFADRLLSARTRQLMLNLRAGWQVGGDGAHLTVYRDGTGSYGQGVTVRYYPAQRAKLIILSNRYAGEYPPRFAQLATQLEQQVIGVGK